MLPKATSRRRYYNPQSGATTTLSASTCGKARRIRCAITDLNSAEFIGVNVIAALPTWPFRALILAGFAVAAIEFAVRVISALRQAARGRP